MPHALAAIAAWRLREQLKNHDLGSPDEVDAAARYRATSRTALVAAWLAEKLGQDSAEAAGPR
jgi:hypothetical protein